MLTERSGERHLKFDGLGMNMDDISDGDFIDINLTNSNRDIGKQSMGDGIGYNGMNNYS